MAQDFIPVYKQTTVEVPIGTGQLSIGDIATLRGKKIVYIETFHDSDVTITPLGRTPVTDAALKASFLTLAKAGTDRPIENRPLTSLIKADNSGVIQPLDYIVVDWVNSFLQCPDTAAVSANAGNYYLLVVQYEDDIIGRKC